MFGLASATSTLPNAQMGAYLYQFRLQQARQEAARANSEVQQLEERTRQAHRQAERASGRLQDVERGASEFMSGVDQTPDETVKTPSGKSGVQGVRVDHVSGQQFNLIGQVIGLHLDVTA